MTRATRRSFLRGATGAATAAVTAFAATRDATGVQESVSSAVGAGVSPAMACCAKDSALGLIGAAFYQGAYVGLVSSKTGPELVTLNIDSSLQRVSLGSPLKLNLPEGFVFSSLGLARGRLALAGGVPFILESFEVDDEMSAEVRAAMDFVPAGLPMGGRRRIDVTGVKPAVLFVDASSVEPLTLPETAKHSYAVATSVVETASGRLLVLIEHSDGVNESYYASAADLIEQTLEGQWTSRSIAKSLGESGPNHLAVNGDAMLMAFNTTEGAKLVSPEGALTSIAAEAPDMNRVLALIPSDSGFSVLTANTAGGVNRLSAGRAASAWSDAGAVGLREDIVVGTVPIAGAPGQTILLGRKFARLIDNALASGLM
jgi:hypothetical protein